MEENKRPETVVREGAIAASIWKRQGSRGMYYEYSVSRSFKAADSDKFGYSGAFRIRDTETLVRCIERAGQWIAEQHQGCDQGRPTSGSGAQAGPAASVDRPGLRHSKTR